MSKFDINNGYCAHLDSIINNDNGNILYNFLNKFGSKYGGFGIIILWIIKMYYCISILKDPQSRQQ